MVSFQVRNGAIHTCFMVRGRQYFDRWNLLETMQETAVLASMMPKPISCYCRELPAMCVALVLSKAGSVIIIGLDIHSHFLGIFLIAIANLSCLADSLTNWGESEKQLI